MSKIKFLALVTVLSLVAMPAMASAEALTNGLVSTGLTRDTSGGATPIVKAKWEANADRYTDDAITAGAQFKPSGVKDTNKTISICAVVTDPDGLADINNVYGDVFYPENVELGTSHVNLPSQSGLGCGKLMQEDKMTKLSKADGIALFCNMVRTNNPNLPTFNFLPGSTSVKYDYDEICAETGELWKDEAAVYCVNKDLSYEDPAGTYKVWAVGQDKVGLQGILENSFTYLPLTAFETDFTSINYGNVRLNTHKVISGDKTWGNGIASVRNIGNTRLLMKVVQDDMGFGMTDGVYNVKYDGRVGSAASFVNYWPNASPKGLPDALDLSEMDEMDFSIDISKFPPTHEGSAYSGTMTLSAVSQAHLTCTPQI